MATSPLLSDEDRQVMHARLSQPALESHWKVFGVNASKEVIQVPPKDVRDLMSKKKKDVTVRTVGKISSTWELWDSKEFDEDSQEVVFHALNSVDYMIVRVYENTIMAKTLEDCVSKSKKLPYKFWSAAVLMQHSTFDVVYKAGLYANNDDLPIRFTGKGGIKRDFVAFATRYERYEQNNDDSSTLPEPMFELDVFGKMTKLYAPDCSNPSWYSHLTQYSSSSLRTHFFFNAKGEVGSADANSEISNHYYAIMMTKGWWYKTLFETIAVVLLEGVDKFISFMMVFSLLRASMEGVILYAVIYISFQALVLHVCFLRSKIDMSIDTNVDDLALPEANDYAHNWMLLVHVLLYYLRISNDLKDILIWTNVRGGTMGRANLKINKARCAIMTWPSKVFHDCDRTRGVHEVDFWCFVRDCISFLFVLNLRRLDFLGFNMFLLSKFVLLLWTSSQIWRAKESRSRLKDWCKGKLEDLKGNENTHEWKVVSKVIREHFNCGSKDELNEISDIQLFAGTLAQGFGFMPGHWPKALAKLHHTGSR